MIALRKIMSEVHLRIVAAENVARFFIKFHFDNGSADDLIGNLRGKIFEEDSVAIVNEIDLFARGKE